MRSSWLAIALLAGCGGAPSAPPAAPAPSLVLAPGTTWIYVNEQGKELRTVVEGPAVVDGAPCMKLRGCSVGVSESRWESQDVAYWSLRDGLLQLHGTGEDDWQLSARMPMPLYRKDARRGMSWAGRFAAKDERTGQEDAAGCRVVPGSREEISTPAGIFNAWHVVEEWTYRGKVMVRTENWWSEEVGLVRQWYRLYRDDVAIRTLRIELKAFMAVKRGER